MRKYTTLPLDVHLMVEEPGRYLADYAAAGANILTVQAEACKHLHRTIQQITALGCKAGVAINPATPIEALREVLPFVDMVLVMSVNPGFGSQKFIETSTSKLRRMRKLMDELAPAGRSGSGRRDRHAQHRATLWTVGANVIVVGSAVYNQRATVAENLARLRKAALSEEDQ